MLSVEDVTRVNGNLIDTQYFSLGDDCPLEFKHYCTMVKIPVRRYYGLYAQGLLYCVLADVKSMFDSMREEDTNTSYSIYMEDPEVVIGIDHWDKIISVKGMGIKCVQDSSGTCTEYPITIKQEKVQEIVVEYVEIPTWEGLCCVVPTYDSGGKLILEAKRLINKNGEVVTSGSIYNGARIRSTLTTVEVGGPTCESWTYLTDIEIIEEQPCDIGKIVDTMKGVLDDLEL